MTKVSLARIMYGTNQDLHVPEPMTTSGVPVAAAPAVNNASPFELPTLDELLHHAWSRLTHRS